MPGSSGNQAIIRGFSNGGVVMRDSLNAVTAAGFRTDFDDYNVERVEVLKGPASVLFGRTQPGGVINVVTRSGGNVFSGSVRENLSNPSWITRTPRERQNNVTHNDTLNKVHEGTLGGPLLRERLLELSRVVKAFEIKLSQGAKPGHGGVLPGPKVTAEIAAARGVPVGVDCVSPAAHSAFGTPEELLQFVVRLRELSGGKPTGFKLCIGHPWEWFAICKAMLSSGITPDFIVVDGGEGGTGAAPIFSRIAEAAVRHGGVSPSVNPAPPMPII